MNASTVQNRVAGRKDLKTMQRHFVGLVVGGWRTSSQCVGSHLSLNFPFDKPQGDRFSAAAFGANGDCEIEMAQYVWIEQSYRQVR